MSYDSESRSPSTPPTYGHRPLHEDPAIHDRRWFLLGVMCLSLVMVVMAVAGLNVAIPQMQDDLGATATDLQWIVDSYAIVFAGLLLSAGAIGDRFGRKLALQGGLCLFLVGSLMGAVADSPTAVIVARVVMGIGAAFIMPATLSILTAVFPPHERGKAIAVWAGFAGAGGALGPLLVGALLTGIDLGPFKFGPFWWGSAFVANLAAIIPTMIAVAVFAPRSKDDRVTPLDPVGAVLSMVGISALLFAIIEGPTKGWTSTPVVAGFVIAVVGVAAFLVWEFRSRHPMLPLQFFRDRRFSVGSFVITMSFLVMFGFFFLVSQYLQFSRGYSPLLAGVATLPFAGTMLVVAPLSSSVANRYGYRGSVAFGFLMTSVGFLGLAFVSSSSPYWQIAILFIVIAAGQGLVAPSSTGAIMSSVPLNRAGVGSAVNDTTRELGGALGIALLGSIATTAYRSGIDLTAFPADVQIGAEESIGAAIGIAERVGGPEGESLRTIAADAFTDSVNVVMAVAAVINVVISLTVLRVGHRHVSDPDLAPAPLAAAVGD